jgi:DNA polymerase III subunit epsilon
LDALCKRYSVDNSRRELHGALLDAQILADVYLAMTGGQTALILGEEQEAEVSIGSEVALLPIARGKLRIVRASEDELAAHERTLLALDKVSGGKTIWRTIQETRLEAEERDRIAEQSSLEIAV